MHPSETQPSRLTLNAWASSLFGLWLGAAAPGHLTAHAQTEPCTTSNLLAAKLPSRMERVRRDTALVTDGAAVPEGQRWNSELAVMMDSSASELTYDLGRLQQLSAVYLQADANDTYTLSISSDGGEGTFVAVAELPNVVASGHGLRGRVARFDPVSARFVRLGNPRGDEAYSVSELQLFCQPPTPFPPELKVLSPGLARSQPPDALALREASVAERQVHWLTAAAGLGAFALCAFFVERRRRHWAGPLQPFAAAPAQPLVDPPRHSSALACTPAIERLLLAMVVASGCAALTYEIVWVHLLRLVIGASSLSVGIVLASFMGGMFIGSLALGKWVSRARNPLIVYALLEVGIALCGLLMPLVLPFVRSVYADSAGHGPLGIALRAIIAAIMLLPPTALMGATLPAIARRYSHTRVGNARLASLYAANTLGAVLGCLLCGFYLLAVWDVWVATFSAAALNLAIAALAYQRARVTPHTAAVSDAQGELLPAPRRGAAVVYLATALSGATALGAQVLWTRVLTLLFGATVYAFSIILAVFLGGLGIGAILAARAIQRGIDPLRGLAWTQLGLVPALLWAAGLLADVLPYSSPAPLTPVGSLHALHVLRALEVTLPAAVLWGMSFPFALAAVEHDDPGRSTGQVYAANTVGSILGALSVSFWAIPARGTHWAAQALIMVAAVSAAAILARLARSSASPAPAAVGGRRAWPALVVLALGAVGAALTPAISGIFLAHGRHIWSVDARDQYPYISEGASSTVAVHVAPDSSQHFHVSGRVEASNNPADMRLQRLLGHLSALAHPNPKRVLVVGLGGGVTAGSLVLHPEIERIVICEIEPRVVGAARLFARENHGVLDDPRVEVVFDDARHFLATTDERFDIITSDPIHPWVRGNSILFSREYYEIVKSRLTPNGIATQWVPLYDTVEEAIQIQLRTFLAAFPDGSVWNSSASMRGYDVVLLGRPDGAALDVPGIQRRLEASPGLRASLSEVGIQSVYDLLATYGTSGSAMQGWVASVSENRDFSLKLEYISGLSLNQQAADAIYTHMVAGRTVPQGLFAGPDDMLAELRARILSGQ